MQFTVVQFSLANLNAEYFLSLCYFFFLIIKRCLFQAMNESDPINEKFLAFKCGFSQWRRVNGADPTAREEAWASS